MDKDDVTRWLEGYVAAWRDNRRELIEALFTDAAEYRYLPGERPLVGATAIASSWLENPDDPEAWEASYTPFAVDGDTAVAVGTSRYRATAGRPARTYHNCFLLRFDADGRCREFTEFFVQETPAGG